MTAISAYNLPEETLKEAVRELEGMQFLKRLWQEDDSLWPQAPGEKSGRLGWLKAPEAAKGYTSKICAYAEEVRCRGIKKVVLLGMGGSSEAAQAFSKLAGAKTGWPELKMLDTTNPDTIAAAQKNLLLASTHFIVSSKSGKTTETLALLQYFYHQAVLKLGRKTAGSHFTAITDPGSYLEKLATELNFFRLFLNAPDIGGRFSAFSYFGLVPAATLGLNLDKLLEGALLATRKARNFKISPTENSAAWLGAVLAACACQGKNKLIFSLTPPFAGFFGWVEQLVAESTGKGSLSLLPVEAAALKQMTGFSDESLFLFFQPQGSRPGEKSRQELIKKGCPLLLFKPGSPYSLAEEMYRFMLATAVAGFLLKINPFDQPNVEAAKTKAREFVHAYQKQGSLPLLKADYTEKEVAVLSGFKAESLGETWNLFLDNLDTTSRPRGYISIQAYLPHNLAVAEALQGLQQKLQERCKVAITLGYGPRYLHSTGQLHKGDAGKGLFVQLTKEPEAELLIPGFEGENKHKVSFNVLLKAQAAGDRQALIEAGRKVITFHLKRGITESLNKLGEAL